MSDIGSSLETAERALPQADTLKHSLITEEDTQRQKSLEVAKSYFGREDIQAKSEQIAREIDPQKRVAMVRDFCIQTNGIIMGEENPEFGVNVRVQQSDIDHQTAIEWSPPRPMNDIFDEYFEEIGNLLRAGNNKDAASVIFQAISLGHPFRNGNGRTARLLFLHTLNPQITKEPDFIERYIMDEDVQAESRATCDDIFIDAVGVIKQKANITDLPFIMINGITRSGGASNEMLRVAYKQLHPNNTPFVMHLDEIPQNEEAALRQKTNDIGREALRDILHSPKARARTFEGMWTKQSK